MSSDRPVRVTFQPQGRSVHVLPGTTVLEAAAGAGLAVDTPCGGQGTCGKCRVQFLSGACPPTAREKHQFHHREIEQGWRLACQSALCNDAAVRVPASSLFADQVQILAEAQKAAAPVQPAVRKVLVKLAAPTLEDPSADLLRLRGHLGEDVKVDLPLLRRLPVLLREHGFGGTAVLADHRLIAFEPGDTRGECHGVAADIGTTTLVASLLDLNTGQERGLVSRVNPQVNWGDDVLARIQHASGGAGALGELQRAVAGAVGEMIDELCQQAGVERRTIYEIALAGNTTMEHLLCGIDVRPLGQVPFAPAFAGGLLLPAAEVGIPIAEGGAAYVFPVIGGFVGGDTSAGILAANLEEGDSPVLFIDIGTNGEIVVAHKGEILAASTAAGPAFEGARISCGMRAAAGAIEKVVFDGDLRCGVIGDAPPAGLCGSGLIDLAAELLRAGFISPEGRLLPPEELPAAAPEALRRRMVLGANGQSEFLLGASDTEPALAGDPSAPRRTPLSLTARDVRELQLATGAIRAGITILLQQAGLKTKHLKRVLVAGGFGSFIRRSNAQRIGLLPAEVDHRRIHYIGNSSLEGARLALVSVEARRRAETLAGRTRHVELSQDAEFQTVFADSMIFPEEAS